MRLPQHQQRTTPDTVRVEWKPVCVGVFAECRELHIELHILGNRTVC